MARLGWTDEDIYRVSERAHSLLKEGHHEEAAVLFQGLIVVDEKNAYCWNGLAACHLARGDVARALEVLNELLRLTPGDAQGRARRCEALLRLGRLGEAFEDLEWLRQSRAVAAAQRLEMMFRQASDGFDSDQQLTTSIGDN